MNYLITILTLLALALSVQAQDAELLDRLPDFSQAGYRAGKNIPNIATEITVTENQSIEKAIEQLAKYPIKQHGYRGAILIEGKHELKNKTLEILHDGIVLRGGKGATIYHVEGYPLNTLNIGKYQKELELEPIGKVLDVRLEAGESRFVSSVPLEKGERFWIVWRPNEKFIASQELTEHWKPEELEIRWEREVKTIRGRMVTLDQPLTSSIDAQFGEATICKLKNDTRIHRVGIENITFVSEFNPDVVDANNDFIDENHAKVGVEFRSAKDCWIRNCEFKYYSMAAVQVRHISRRITIDRCASFDGVSKDTQKIHSGGKEYAFSIGGSDVLVRECFARFARHGFICNATQATNVVFLDNVNDSAHLHCEPHQKWSSAILYDRHTSDTGIYLAGYPTSSHGQKTTNSVVWNAEIKNYRTWEPTLALNSPKENFGNNFAVGNIYNGKSELHFQNYGEKGIEISPQKHVEPSSLYLFQSGNKERNKKQWQKQIETWRATPEFGTRE